MYQKYMLQLKEKRKEKINDYREKLKN